MQKNKSTTFFYIPFARGFTLIELVCVIVILGILATTAMPRFISVSKQARIASVRTLKGTLQATSMLWHALCLSDVQCSNNPAGFYYLTDGGKTYLIVDSYPEAGDSINNDQIDAMISYSGFEVSLPSNLSTKFSLSNAPSPSSCAVTYTQATGYNNPPVINETITGC